MALRPLRTPLMDDDAVAGGVFGTLRYLLRPYLLLFAGFSGFIELSREF